MGKIKKEKPVKINSEMKIPIKTIKKIKKVELKIEKVVNETLFKLKVDEDQLKQGISAFLAFLKATTTNKLFDEETPVFVQIQCIKIPIGPNRRLRINLKHSLVTDQSEVCLFVPDLKRGSRFDHEPTIEHYENLLREKDVKCIKRIIPMRQVKVEYDQFELKRRLCGYYDYFLADGRISGHLSHYLGKCFYEKRKLPIPIRLDSFNLKTTIEDALKKVQLNLHSNGNSYAVQIGNVAMAIDALKENLIAVIETLAKDFPGGWNNIRSVAVTTDKSIAVPVYVSLHDGKNVPVPKIKPLRPKLFQTVRGELSTHLKSDITIDPSGQIQLHPTIVPESDDDVDFQDPENFFDASDDEIDHAGPGDYNNEEIDEEEDDVLAATAEQAYMENLERNKSKRKHSKKEVDDDDGGGIEKEVVEKKKSKKKRSKSKVTDASENDLDEEVVKKLDDFVKRGKNKKRATKVKIHK